MTSLQKILVQAAKKLEECLPENVRVVMILADTKTGEALATSDLPSEKATALLEYGIEQFKKPVEFTFTTQDENSDKDRQSN